MLRFGFVACDFHPMMLLLGDAEGLAGLATLLEGFAGHGADIAIGPDPQAGTTIRLTRTGPPGLRRAGPEPADFVWSLPAAEAREVAARVASLAVPERVAGSEWLDFGRPGELPVKVSRGEFSPDVLASIV